MASDRSVGEVKHHLVTTGLLLAVNLVFLVQAASDHSTIGVLVWSVLAVVTVAHLLSLVTRYRRQS
jgi:uncharacterized membrane protein YesL